MARAVAFAALGVGPLSPARGRTVAPVATPMTVETFDRSLAVPLGPSGGRVDWTARTLYSHGRSDGPIGAYLPPQVAPYAQRRAESLAQDGLIRLLHATPLGPSRTVGAALAQHPQVGALVFSAVRKMRVIQARYDAHGGVALDVALDLDTSQGGLGAVWAALRAHEAAAAAAAATDAPAPKVAPSDDAAGSPPSSGIVINARGLGFVPCVFPRIVDGAGALLYGAQSLPDDVLILRGLMGATRSLEVAMADSLVAPSPKVLGAKPCAPDDPHTLVLGDDDARTFASLHALAADGRIVVVVD